MLLALELEELELMLLLKQQQSKQNEENQKYQEDLDKIRNFIPEAKLPAESRGLIGQSVYTMYTAHT